MALKNLAAAGILALGALAAAPASAGTSVSVSIEFGGPAYASYNHHHSFSPQQVRRILRREGFSHIRYVDRRGSVYRALAENHRGRDVLVTVSARTGHILDVDRLGRHG